MWVCRECGKAFEEPDLVRYECEDYAGVGGWFDDTHYSWYEECPYCGSERIIICQEDEDDEFDEFDA